MTLQDRISLSAEDLSRRLEQGLDRLRRFQYDTRYKRLLGENLIRNLEKWDENIRARRNDPLSIVVIGEFKRGKSSFINALLGEKVLVTDVTPETVTMNQLSYGISKNEAVLSGGRRLSLKNSELSRKALEKMMAEIGEPIRKLDLQRPNEWLRNIRIFDTPGLNESTDSDHITTEALAQADVVIYIFSAVYPLSHTEQMYLKYAVLPQKYTSLFLVGNYGDLLETEDNYHKISNELYERTAEILPGEKIYIVSALDALCREAGASAPCENLSELLNQQFEDLKQDFSDMVADKKQFVAVERMSRMARAMASELTLELDNITNGLAMDGRKIEEERQRLHAAKERQIELLHIAEGRIDESVGRMKGQALDWTAQLLEKMEKENLSRYSVQDIFQFYPYYCINLLQTGVLRCLEQHREELLDLMAGISNELGQKLSVSYTEEDTVDFSLRLDSGTWTKGDSITLAITQISSNSLINAATDLFGSLFRKKEIDLDKGKVLEDIRRKYPELRGELEKTIEEKYAKLGDSAKKLLEEHFQEQISRTEGKLKQFEESSRKSDEDKALTAEAVEEFKAELARLETA